MQLQRGDILVFKGSGVLFEILSRLLKLFESSYDRWGWHTAFVADRVFICESKGAGIVLTPVRDLDSAKVRVYRWFAQPPEEEQVQKYVAEHLGKKYDVLIYAWTTLQYLARHFWNKPIPRLLDDRYTCWENVFEFCEDMGKRLASRYDCPLITDLLKAVEGKRVW